MKIKLAHTMDIAAQIGEPLEIGITPSGRQRMIPITGGTFEGPGLKGVILSGGADWQVTSGKDYTRLEARYSLKTDDGVVIAVVNRCLHRGPRRAVPWLGEGEDEESPAGYYFRGTPLFAVEEGERYGWLNDYVFVATCEVRDGVVWVRVFRIL